MDFGCVQEHTIKRSNLLLRNKSEFEVHYYWTLSQGEGLCCHEYHSLTVLCTEQLESEDHLFDIRPIKGILLPGDSDQTVISYFAKRNSFSNSFAFCHVEGGPTYKVRHFLMIVVSGMSS